MPRRRATLGPVEATAHASTAESAPGRSLPAAVSGSTPGWLGPFFALAGACPTLTARLRPLASRLVPACSPTVRRATALNARRIFGRGLSAGEQRRFARAVSGSFFDFVAEVAAAASQPPAAVRARIERVEGLEAYRTARASGSGAVLVTAHLGSFEAGLAALADAEPRVRVVFRRDHSDRFEGHRMRLRERLGIVEAPIDDGPASWLPLRDALLNNEVVVLQGDRAVRGQRSQVVPFLHGHLRLPTGPVRLARLTGSPIIPVYTPRLPSGRIAVTLDTPIQPRDDGSDLASLVASLERIVSRHPEQWLAFEPVFAEDAAHAG